MNANDIDQLINDNINEDNNLENNIKYDLLIFSDGAHERVKKRSSFGIYIYCENNTSEFNKYNDTKIIKKIERDQFFYNKNNFDIIYYNYINNNNQCIKCQNESCNYYAIYNYENENNGKYCKNHKLDNMDILINYFIYEPTNIRAEGFGILYSLIYIKLILVDKIIEKNELNKKLNITSINNIKDSIKVIDKYKINEYKYKFLIITDSEFWINVITKWCNNWVKKNQYLDKKNIDIILYINYYLHLLNNEKILIDFKFVRGHSDKNNNNNSLNIYQKGNVMADKLANIGKENLDIVIKLI